MFNLIYELCLFIFIKLFINTSWIFHWGEQYRINYCLNGSAHLYTNSASKILPLYWDIPSSLWVIADVKHHCHFTELEWHAKDCLEIWCGIDHPWFITAPSFHNDALLVGELELISAIHHGQINEYSHCTVTFLSKIAMMQNISMIINSF